MRRPIRWWRRLWAAPVTLLGGLLALPLLLAGGRLARHEGVLEVSPPLRPRRAGGAGRGAFGRLFDRFDAITLGHLVIARSPVHHAALRAHERVHVRQYECWGPFFLLAYPAESAWQWLRGRCPYRDNRFEVQARRGALAGGGARAAATDPG